MRLWHYELLPYLPELQFKGQLRELVAIMHDWRDKGKTNHLLINRVMNYDKAALARYFIYYETCYHQRYGVWLNPKYFKEFQEFAEFEPKPESYLNSWHNEEYLRVCMANLYEKHHFGIGKSRITDDEWKRLVDGYKQITNEDWVL